MRCLGPASVAYPYGLQRVTRGQPSALGTSLSSVRGGAGPESGGPSSAASGRSASRAGGRTARTGRRSRESFLGVASEQGALQFGLAFHADLAGRHLRRRGLLLGLGRFGVHVADRLADLLGDVRRPGPPRV